MYITCHYNQVLWRQNGAASEADFWSGHVDGMWEQYLKWATHLDPQHIHTHVPHTSLSFMLFLGHFRKFWRKEIGEMPRLGV